ncbi:MAG: MBL fold metallo-hydrolase [Candidatus Puniceispirillaceae bacterium]
MKVTLLGCGTSVGVPALGHAGWGSCNPDDPRNRRQRCAVLVQTDSTTVLVDAGPDIRNQLMPLGLKKIDALLVTHTHSDHIAGLDDLRAFYWPDRVELPVRTTSRHSADIKHRFPYLFEKDPNSPSYFVPPMRMEQIEAGSKINIGDVEVDIFHQDHGNAESLGFLFNGKFAYSTDVVGLEDAVLDAIAGVPLWIVEALRETPHQAHSHYEQTFAWIERVRPARAVLTHLGLEADYEKLAQICPPRTEPGIDGMVFSL